MDFSPKKLVREEAQRLRPVSEAYLRPYRLIFAPIYVHLSRNGKFLSVKAPLDFFDPGEIDRLRGCSGFFSTEFIESVKPFTAAGATVRSILTRFDNYEQGQASRPAERRSLPPAPFEISDAILRTIGPLWAEEGKIEPYFIAAFADELCGGIDPEALKDARDQDVAQYECALLRAGLVAFFGLHLGYCNLNYLNRIHLQVFSNAVNRIPIVHPKSEPEELIQLVTSLVPDNQGNVLTLEWIRSFGYRVAEKISGRLLRVISELIDHEKSAATIYGVSGFRDV